MAIRAGRGRLDVGRDAAMVKRRQTTIDGHSSSGGEMNLENFVMILISFLLMVYLVYALLRPEKF